MSKILLISKQTIKILLITTLVIFYLTAYVVAVFTIGFLAMFTNKYSFKNQLKDIFTLNPKAPIDELIKSRLNPINKIFLFLLHLIRKW